MRTLIQAGATAAVGRRLFAADQDDFLIRSEVRLVLLDVSVRNRDGNVVQGLSKTSFKIFENGQPQEISVFDHEDLPVTIGILVDESQSMTPKRADVLTAALTFLGESNPNDEVFVLNFNDTVMPGLPSAMLFSDDHNELRAALFRGISEGRTALYDAVVAGLDQLEMGRRAKKALILISDGGDNCSKHTRRETLDRIERSIATVHTIGLFDMTDPDRDPGILRQLAKISGGEAYFPEASAEMVPVCQRIAHDIRSRYTLGYHPQPGKGTNDIRHIRVDVSAPGHGSLITRTRTSYRYDELAAHK